MSHSNALPLVSYKSSNPLRGKFGYSVLATITNVNMENFHFLAFPLFVDGIQCMKTISHKVGNISHHGKCDGEFLECDYRCITKVDLEDVSWHLYGVIAFDDVANQLMGVSVKDLCLLSTKATSLGEIAWNIYNKQFLFTLSVRIDAFCGTTCLKVVIVMLE